MPEPDRGAPCHHGCKSWEKTKTTTELCFSLILLKVGNALTFRLLPQRAFESLAKRAAVLSKSLFKFTRGASHLWEVHSAGLQRREQQLQDQLDEVRYSQEHEIQVSLIPSSHHQPPPQHCPATTRTKDTDSRTRPPDNSHWCLFSRRRRLILMLCWTDWDRRALKKHSKSRWRRLYTPWMK